MRLLSLCLFCLTLTSAHALEVSRIIEGKPIVVELFTSQGCNSCPPADALLGALSKQRNVIALSQHVDYWDYLGWRDPFSSHLATMRQKLYAARWNTTRIYTPQMVVAGQQEVLGSHKRRVSQSLREVTPPKNNMSVTIKGSLAHFTLEENPSFKNSDAILWVAELDEKKTSHITRGENSGKNLTYHHVVRDFYPVGKWDGSASIHTIDLQKLWMKGRDGIAVILQEKPDFTGPIRAAAALFLTD